MIVDHVSGKLASDEIRALVRRHAQKLRNVSIQKMEFHKGDVQVDCLVTLTVGRLPVPALPVTITLKPVCRGAGIWVPIDDVELHVHSFSFGMGGVLGLALPCLMRDVKSALGEVNGLTVLDDGVMVDPRVIMDRPDIMLKGNFMRCDVLEDGVSFEFGDRE